MEYSLDVFNLEITDLDSEGRGVARLDDGCVVFVPFCMQGERVTARIVRKKKNFAEAELIEVLRASQGRVTPACSVFKTCGGCSLQHMNYASQLEFKTELVASQLKKIGGIKTLQVLPCVASSKQLHYRNKAVYRLKYESGALKMGFFEERSHRIVDAQSCQICSKAIVETARLIRNHIETCKNSHLAKLAQGTLDEITIRELDGSILIDIATSCQKVSLANLRDELDCQALGVFATRGGKTKHIFGEKTIRASLGDIVFDASMQTFLQVNSEVAAKLYEAVIAKFKHTPSDIIIDAYCGMGILTAQLAKHASEVYGIEICPEAIDDAKRLTAQNDLKNISYITADCAKALPELLSNLARAQKETTVVLDPPRKGCATEVLSSLIQNPPARLIYISCNTATLARDIMHLSQTYAITSITPFDMFPQTSEVETLVELVRKTTEKSS